VKGYRVYLFKTCIVSHLYPEVFRATRRLLEAFGLEVLVPDDQTCCGLPAFSSGNWRVAKKVARHFLNVFRDPKTPIVIPSGSCTHMIRAHYQMLFERDLQWRDLVREVASRTFELTEFLVDQLKVSFVGHLRRRVLFNDSCQALRGLKISEQPIRLISGVEGLEPASPGFRAEALDRCCGFGGLFHLRYPEISRAMRDAKLRIISRAAPELLVGLDMGCLHHLKRGLKEMDLPIETMHMAQFLLLAMGDHA
jgi:L-lactate dehydrogenase complex protein LldE